MSMSGVYDVNDVIIVKDWDTSTLEVGDEIWYIYRHGEIRAVFFNN